MTFQTGQTPNYSGSSKLAKAKSLAKSFSIESLNVLASIQNDSSVSAELRVDAAKSILSFSSSKAANL